MKGFKEDVGSNDCEDDLSFVTKFPKPFTVC
jgi:hypothetical protein